MATTQCLIACQNNDLQTIISLKNVYIHKNNEAIFKNACTLSDPLPMMDLLYTLYPTINFHIDNDFIAKKAIDDHRTDVIRWLLNKERDLEAWEDFSYIITRSIYDHDLFHELLTMIAIDDYYPDLLIQICKNNDLELLQEVFDQTKVFTYNRLYEIGIHPDLKIATFLSDHGFIPDSGIFHLYFKKDDISICQWLLDHNAIVNFDNLMSTPVLESEGSRWAMILEGVNNIKNVTTIMIAYAMKSCVYGNKLDILKTLLLKFPDFNIDHCIDCEYLTKFLIKKHILRTETIPLLIYLAKYSSKCASFLNVNLLSGLAGYKTYKELEVIRKSYTGSWSYVDICKEACNQLNFILCNDLLTNILWLDEVFDDMFNHALKLNCTNACQYWYNKAPHLALNYLQKDHIKSSFLNICWLVCITYGVNDTLYRKFYNYVRDKRFILVKYNNKGVTCLHCKTQNHVLELPCGHCFCFRSIVEFRVHRNLKIDKYCDDYCKQCNQTYKIGLCNEYTSFFSTQHI